MTASGATMEKTEAKQQSDDASLATYLIEQLKPSTGWELDSPRSLRGGGEIRELSSSLGVKEESGRSSLLVSQSSQKNKAARNRLADQAGSHVVNESGKAPTTSLTDDQEDSSLKVSALTRNRVAESGQETRRRSFNNSFGTLDSDKTLLRSNSAGPYRGKHRQGDAKELGSSPTSAFAAWENEKPNISQADRLAVVPTEVLEEKPSQKTKETAADLTDDLPSTSKTADDMKNQIEQQLAHFVPGEVSSHETASSNNVVLTSQEKGVEEKGNTMDDILSSEAKGVGRNRSRRHSASASTSNPKREGMRHGGLKKQKSASRRKLKHLPAPSDHEKQKVREEMDQMQTELEVLQKRTASSDSQNPSLERYFLRFESTGDAEREPAEAKSVDRKNREGAKTSGKSLLRRVGSLPLLHRDSKEEEPVRRKRLSETAASIETSNADGGTTQLSGQQPTKQHSAGSKKRFLVFGRKAKSTRMKPEKPSPEQNGDEERTHSSRVDPSSAKKSIRRARSDYARLSDNQASSAQSRVSKATEHNDAFRVDAAPSPENSAEEEKTEETVSELVEILPFNVSNRHFKYV